MNWELAKDDFYEAVNEEWLKKVKIPTDKYTVGGFQDLTENIEKLLMRDTQEMTSTKNSCWESPMINYLDYFKCASDYCTRNRQGIEPFLSFFNKIESLNNFSELNEQITDWFVSDMPLPFDLTILPDMKNVKSKAIYVSEPLLLLRDKSYYDKSNVHAKRLLTSFVEMNEQILIIIGKTFKEAKQIVGEALKFENWLAIHVKDIQDRANYAKCYNPVNYEEFTCFFATIDTSKILEELLGEVPEKIVVTDPVFFSKLNRLITTDKFNLFKSWSMVKLIDIASEYLSEEIRQIYAEFKKIQLGTAKIESQQTAAFHIASKRFDQVIGKYYGVTYFGKEAKKDIERMVIKILNIFQRRLKDNVWLSAKAKKQARTKLTKLIYHVGYPENIPKIFADLKVVPTSEGGSLLSNEMNFRKILKQDSFDRWREPVEVDEWDMSAHTVNAYYDPLKNTINFPAAILQPPFYGVTQSISQNLGGIGAIIGHEISHAFDLNGSQFDEYGNLKNWWANKDIETFKNLSKRMMKLFDKIDFNGEPVNGKLTLSENIADASGLQCALEAIKEENADLNDFFISWGKIWRMKSRDDYTRLLLKIDTHAPAKLRANIQLKNITDFHTTFNIKPSDDMYLSSDKQVIIW